MTRAFRAFRSCVAILLAIPLLAIASPGDPDPGFGNGGVVSYDFASTSDIDVRASAQIPMGGLLVAGTIPQGDSGDRTVVVGRFDLFGAIDPSFANGGWAAPMLPANTIPFAVVLANGQPTVLAQNGGDLYFVFIINNGQSSYYTVSSISGSFGMPVLRSVAVEADGSFLVTGTKYEFGPAGEAFVSRYSADGYLDTAFGSYGTFSLAADPAHVEGQAVAEESDGSIVLAATTDAAGNRDMMVAHLSSSGVLDTSFGQGGTVTADNQGYDDTPGFIGWDWAGRILVGGTSRHVDANGQSIGELFLWRMSAQGVDDYEFGAQSGTPGRFVTSIPISAPGDSDTQFASLAFDGPFITIGATVRNLATTDTDFALMHLADNATPDTYFGNCDGGLCGKYVGPSTPHADTLVMVTAPMSGYMFAVGGSPSEAVIARYSSSGYADVSYGDNGRAAFQPTVTPHAWMADMALQADGRFVAVGSVDGESFSRVGRFNPDGSLDQTFGVAGFAAGPWLSGGARQARVVVQSDGKIIVAGNSTSVLASRLMPDGSADLTWGAGTGTVSLAGNGIDALALQQDGKLLVVLDVFGSPDQVRVGRFNLDGTLDPAFGTNGYVTIPPPPNSLGQGALGIRVGQDGTILIAGSARIAGSPSGHNAIAVSKLLASGALDATWGNDGTTVLDTGSDALGFDVETTNAGQVIVVGGCGYATCVARLNADGSLDSSFGSNGFVTQDFNPYMADRGDAIQLDGWGQMYIGVDVGYFTTTAVGRLLSDGSRDGTFNHGSGWVGEMNGDFVGGRLLGNGNYLVAMNDQYSWSFASFQGGIDSTPPDTTLSVTPSTSPTSQTTATATFSSSKQDSTFQCSLDGATFAACTSPAALSGLADGSHTYQVRAIDLYGDIDPTPASYTWTVDTTAPDTTIAGAPTGTTNQQTASLTLSSNESSVTFECSLDNAAFAACTSPVDLSGLADGGHAFQARAKDGAGNVDATPATATWTVDATAPDTTISGAPSGTTSQNGATISLSSNESPVTFECALDGAAFAACTSPVTLSALADGSHTFRARAKDSAGNVDASPASATWTVDTTAPDTSITSAPSGTVAQASATFAFSATEPGTFECRLDAASFATCTSPVTYNGLADGGHTFQVRARDAAGNVDATPASASWAVDTTPPDTSITSAPSGTVASASASIAFAANDGSATFQCSLDGGAFASCANPVLLSGLADGAHAFQVRAIDAVGNIDATPAAASWTVDTTAPDTTITAAPAAITNQATATFQFGASESGDTFQCSMDGGAFSACASPANYSGLADGAHTFAVRAIDAVGNTDASPASYGWTVDTVAPDTTITSGPSGKNNPSTATFAFSSSEVNSTFQCQLDGGGFVACSSPATYSGLVRGSHTFNVRAIDAAGNVDGTPATRTWSTK